MNNFLADRRNPVQPEGTHNIYDKAINNFKVSAIGTGHLFRANRYKTLNYGKKYYIQKFTISGLKY